MRRKLSALIAQFQRFLANFLQKVSYNYKTLIIISYEYQESVRKVLKTTDFFQCAEI